MAVRELRRRRPGVARTAFASDAAGRRRTGPNAYARKNLPIVVVVNSDGAWGLERPGFVMEFGFGAEVEVGWGAVRFDKIAEGFGAHGEYVDRTGGIGRAAASAFARRMGYR